jgi:hypothetical protein
VEVSLQLSDGRLTIEVHDDGAGMPAVVPTSRRVVGGNGLDIVSRLAESWGVTLDGSGGKSVWCVLLPDPIRADPARVDTAGSNHAEPESDGSGQAEIPLVEPGAQLLKDPGQQA